MKEVYFLAGPEIEHQDKLDKMNKQFTITKKIAKHGKQAIIIIPAMLQEYLSPGTMAEIRIEILTSDTK